MHVTINVIVCGSTKCCNHLLAVDKDVACRGGYGVCGA